MGSCCEKNTENAWYIGRRLIRKGDSDVYDDKACYEDDLPKPYQISNEDIYNQNPKFVVVINKRDKIKRIYYG